MVEAPLYNLSSSSGANRSGVVVGVAVETGLYEKWLVTAMIPVVSSLFRGQLRKSCVTLLGLCGVLSVALMSNLAWPDARRKTALPPGAL
jgi:hypothetical protein